ncbi:unnamed protein product [Caenorhabditis brenneri]
MENKLHYIPLVLTNAALAVSTLGFIYYGVTNFLLRNENEWTTIVPCWMFLQIFLIFIERILFWRQEFGQVYFTGMIKYFYIGWRIFTFLSSLLGTFLLFFLVLASVSDAPMSSLFAAGTLTGVILSYTYIMDFGGFSNAPNIYIYGFTMGLYVLKVYFCIFLKFFFGVLMKFCKKEDEIGIAYIEV